VAGQSRRRDLAVSRCNERLPKLLLNLTLIVSSLLAIISYLGRESTHGLARGGMWYRQAWLHRPHLCSDWECVSSARGHSIQASMGKCSRHQISNNLPWQADIGNCKRHAKPVIFATFDLLVAT
jgi:hypothetical protein